MRYKPERALTQFYINNIKNEISFNVEMRYKPERALTLYGHASSIMVLDQVEMRYKPERALTLFYLKIICKNFFRCRNEV